MKKVFGIISWFPDEPTHRKQRLERLNHTFKHLINLFGDEIEFLIIAQNWQDYKVPEFVKHTIIHKFDKLGILGARKMLRTKFLESKYDYLIICLFLVSIGLKSFQFWAITKISILGHK